MKLDNVSLIKCGIYRFSYYCGRMGTVSGIFVAPKEAVNRLYGQTVFFGEVLGKHSNISAEITENNLMLVDDRYDHVCMFTELNLTNGINPLEFVSETFWEEGEDNGCKCVCGGDGN